MRAGMGHERNVIKGKHRGKKVIKNGLYRHIRRKKCILN